ncbi:MAG: hypothetical protein ACI4D3_05385 [Lachnospiraceae bacterium]
MNKINRFLKTLMFFSVCFLTMYTHVSADTGPKPSVIIDIKGLEGETYYVTLLSDSSSTGPWYVGGQDYLDRPDIFQRFSDYQDADGYYFIGFYDDCSGTDSFQWDYYPPKNFKILLYLPEYDTFLVSRPCERYAFDSYYEVSLSGSSDSQTDFSASLIQVRRNYDYLSEVFSFVIRVILTIAVELLTALLFGYRMKNQFLLIAKVNFITQLLLNVILNRVNYESGFQIFVLSYGLMEIFVTAIEAGIYSHAACLTDSGRRRKAVFYAVTANVVSFVSGLYLASVIPAFF